MIFTDSNMPVLSGLLMVKEIKNLIETYELSKNISTGNLDQNAKNRNQPVVFMYSDNI